MKILSITIHILLGLLFILSGFSKIILIEPFEYKLVELGISWEYSLFIARLIIGIEWALGSFLLFYWNFKKTIWYITFLILSIFTLQLSWSVLQGDQSNCGCFGDLIPFTPLQGILKNIIMMGLLALAWYSFKPLNLKWKKIRIYLSIVLGIILITLPFIVNPMNYSTSSTIYNREEVFKLGLDTLYNTPDLQAPTKELRTGKQFISYLSLSCSHCKVAGKKLALIYKQHPDFPLYIILGGHPDLQEDFIKETGIEQVPHYLLQSRKIFFQMAGGSVPTILWVKNDSVYSSSTHLDLNPVQMEEWLKNH